MWTSRVFWFILLAIDFQPIEKLTSLSKQFKVVVVGFFFAFKLQIKFHGWKQSEMTGKKLNFTQFLQTTTSDLHRIGVW